MANDSYSAQHARALLFCPTIGPVLPLKPPEDDPLGNSNHLNACIVIKDEWGIVFAPHNLNSLCTFDVMIVIPMWKHCKRIGTEPVKSLERDTKACSLWMY